jgi:hypothetical protein
VYGLLAAGVLALVTVSIPGGSVLQRASPTALVTGTNPINVTSLAVGGGLLAVGIAAIALGLSLFLARVS